MAISKEDAKIGEIYVDISGSEFELIAIAHNNYGVFQESIIDDHDNSSGIFIWHIPTTVLYKKPKTGYANVYHTPNLQYVSLPYPNLEAADNGELRHVTKLGVLEVEYNEDTGYATKIIRVVK